MLYALERFAHTDPSDNLAHRRTVVEVICAYLRMPYSPVKYQSIDSKLHEQNSKLVEPDTEIGQQVSTEQQSYLGAGSANATTASPIFVPSRFPSPPAAITTNCRPSTR